jgi:hypothetical protein
MSEVANALAPGRRSILPPTPGDERAGAPMHGSVGQLGELGEGGLKVLDDLGGDDARRRKVNRRSPNGEVLIGETNSGTPAGPAGTRWTRRRTAAQVTAPDRTGWTFGNGLLSGRPQVRVLPRAPDSDADGAEGAGRIGTLRSRIGLPGEPVDQLLVEASIRARPFPEPIAILRGCACSDTGSVTVSTPWS